MKIFKTLASHIPSLSFGETKTCFALGTCVQIVSDQSAGALEDGVKHIFMRTSHNHRHVCKPQSKDDMRYASVVQFISEQLNKL